MAEGDGSKSSWELGKVLGDATVALAIASALAYLIAFRFEASYLGYFGVPSHLVSLTLENLIAACSYLIAAATSLYFMLNPIGWLAHPKIQSCLFYFRIIVLLFTIGLLIYYFTGVNWFSFSLLMIGLVFFIIQLSIIVMKKVQGVNFFTLVDADVETARKQQPTLKILDDHFTDKFGPFTFFIVLIAVVGLPAVATMLGESTASKQREFPRLDDGFHLMATRGETGIFVKIESSKATEETLLKNLNTADSLRLTHVRYDKGIDGVLPVPTRTSLREFWQNSVRPLFE